MLYKHTYKKLNDNQIWDCIRKGDKLSLSILFDRYYSRLFNYGYKITAREEFTKDCIQELFLTIWEQRKKVSSVCSVKSYLYVSMRRMIFYNLRKNKNLQKRNTLYAEELLMDTQDIETRIVNLESQKELEFQLSAAINVLSCRQKEIIKLKYSDGLSNSEIAILLKIKRQSVYNHVSEALKQLKYMVKNQQGAGLKIPAYVNNETFS